MSSLRDDPAMTRDAFVAFVETRPDDERWELLDGEPILNPSPSYGHQKVVGNLFFALKALEGDAGPWEALPGLGVILSDRSLPVSRRPDPPVLADPWTFLRRRDRRLRSAFPLVATA